MKKVLIVGGTRDKRVEFARKTVAVMGDDVHSAMIISANPDYCGTSDRDEYAKLLCDFVAFQQNVATGGMFELVFSVDTFDTIDELKCCDDSERASWWDVDDFDIVFDINEYAPYIAAKFLRAE